MNALIYYTEQQFTYGAQSRVNELLLIYIMLLFDANVYGTHTNQFLWLCIAQAHDNNFVFTSD